MKGPGEGVEESDQGSFADAPFEERVCGQGAEGVVADFGICGRGTAVNEMEVGVCGEDIDVEKDEPDVCPILGLFVKRGDGQSTYGCRWTRGVVESSF